MKPRHIAGLVMATLFIYGCVGPQPAEVLLPLYSFTNAERDTLF